MKQTDFLEERLRSWKVSLKGDPELATHVLNRIASGKEDPGVLRIPLVLRWGLGLAAAAALMAGIFLVSQQMERKRMMGEGSYFLLIDPVSRIELQAGSELSPSPDRLVERLAWMQDRLDLSQEQFLDLVDLHRTYSERFDRLYEELVRLDGRFAEFEGLRRQNEMIDFIALYEVLKERRLAEDTSSALSREFISRVTSLLNPDQRATYLSLVQASHASPDA